MEVYPYALSLFRSHAHFEDICNSADPVQMLQNAAADQGLHCFHIGIFMQNSIKVKIFTRNPYK